MCGAEGLSLALACAERCYGAAALGLLCLLGSGEIDGAELLLVAHDVVLKGEEQTLGVLGSHHYAAAHFRTVEPGESLFYEAGEVVLEAHFDAQGVLSCLILRDAMPEGLY